MSSALEKGFHRGFPEDIVSPPKTALCITVLIFYLILTPLFSLWPNQAAKSDSLADRRLCQSDHTCIGRLYFQGYFGISVAMQVDTWGFEKGRHEGAQITHAGYCSSTHGGRHHKKITFIYFMKKKKSYMYTFIHFFAFLWQGIFFSGQTCCIWPEMWLVSVKCN